MNYIWKRLCWFLMVSIYVFAFSLQAAAEDSMVVGVVHREDFAYAAMMRTAYEIALKEINATKGINGRMLELSFADDQGEVEAGEEAVRKLVQKEKAVLLVGGYSSSNTLKMAYEANRLDTPFIVCTAADDQITQHKLKNIYRLNPPVSEYTRGLEEFLIDRVKPATMSIIYENSPFGTGSAMRMMWFCRENNIDIKAIQPYFKKGLTSEFIERILEPIQKDPPDILFMSSYLKDAILLVNKIGEMNIKSLLCGGAGGFTHDDFPRKTPKISEYLLTSTLWSPSSNSHQNKLFIKQFTKQYGKKPDYHAVEAYSALLVAANALRKCQALTAADIRSALESTNMDTPFGKVEFTDYGLYQRQNLSKTPVFQVINNSFETVWPIPLKTAEYQLPPH